ncbi:MAG: dependent oxidoreductase [Phycisphaerales bacterium]|nr:dependent oxidoreductase [Phycisphaerales bacterium]
MLPAMPTHSPSGADAPRAPSRRAVLTSAAAATTGLLVLPFAGRGEVAATAPARREYDVVVYGGVPCGVAAAVAAARAGAAVLLVEPTRHVGGLSTSGINTAESEHMLKWTIGGLALEFYERLGRRYGTNAPEYYFESSEAERVFLAMLREAKVEVRFGLRVERVRKAGARIESVTLSDGSDVAAKAFVDAGYEGDLMARAGVDYTWGRESTAEFGEPLAGFRLDPQPRKGRTVDDAGHLLPGLSVHWKDIPAPGTGDRRVMNYNYRLCLTRAAGKRVPIPPPPAGYDRGRYRMLTDWAAARAAGQPIKLADVLDFYARRNGKYEANNKQAAVVSLGHFGGQFDYPDADYAGRARVVADHRHYTLGLLHFLATDEAVPEPARAEMRAWGLHADEFVDNGNWPYQLYVREARRMRGAYVVRQRDVQDDLRKDDAVGVSSHFIDCHHVQRVALNAGEWANEGRIWRIGWAYQIPYRALTPRPEQAANLLVPGAASYTHVAYCTLRLESVWMIAGQAAGEAAAMAAKSGTTVQAVDVAELRARLVAGKQVIDFAPGQPEKCERLNGPPEF